MSGNTNEKIVLSLIFGFLEIDDIISCKLVSKYKKSFFNSS